MNMKTLKLGSLVILLGLALIACKKDDEDNAGNTNTDNAYAGAWTGTFNGDDNGTWTAAIGTKGELNGSFVSGNTGTTYNVDGTVDANGKFSALIIVGMDTIDFVGQGSNGNTASGTWTNPGFGLNGTWTGNKQ